MPIQAHSGPPASAQTIRAMPTTMRAILSMPPTFFSLVKLLCACGVVGMAGAQSNAGRLGVTTGLPAAVQASKPPAMDCTFR